jgi:multidrug efflux pump subunit AcrB
LAVFVPSFFMVGVGRQLFVPLSLAVAFSMIASYLLSSSLVPVFATWLMKERRQGEERRGVFGWLRSVYGRYLSITLRLRWFVAILYLAVSIGGIWILLPRMGTELFPDSNAPLMRVRLRAPTGTRVEETERIVIHALEIVNRVIGPGNVEITSDFVGVVPSSYPVDLIHLFTSGPQEAIIQIALNPGTARGEPLRENLRAALAKELPGNQVSFEAANIVSQVMSFGSPTPIEVAIQGISLADDYAYAQKVRDQMTKLSFLRDLQFAQASDFPTLDINIDRQRAGQFGLTMADVVRSVVPATSSSRFTQPNYWRDPGSGNAFQIQVQLPQNQMQNVEAIGNVPIMQDNGTETRLTDISAMTLGKMPGLIERYNGQHIVSLTANIHDLTLGQAAVKLKQAIAAERTQRETARRNPATGADPFRTQGRAAPRHSGDPSYALGQLPVLSARSGDRPHHTGGTLRCSADAAAHGHCAECAIFHGGYHGDGNRGRKFDSGGYFLGTRAARRPRLARSCT